MKSRLDRRGFLKLLPLLSLVPLLEGEHHAAAVTRNGSPGREGPPNVCIILFDALSARNLSVHGYRRETTPNLARFAERATVYHSHYAGGNFTVPGVASLLTGTYPWTTRAFHHAGLVVESYERRNMFRLFGDDYYRIAYPQNVWANLMLNQFRGDIDLYIEPGRFSLADGTFYRLLSGDIDIAFRSLDDLVLRGASFPGSLFLSLVKDVGMLGCEQVGLEEYADLYPRGVPRLRDIFFLFEHVIDGTIGLLKCVQRPFLAYFHLFPPHESYYPPHYPYSPRREFIGMFDDGWTAATKEVHPLSRRLSAKSLNRQRVEYDEYVAYVDGEFGRLYDFMSESGLLGDSYVLITSDHGQLFERGVHGHDTPLMYEPVIHIPLLISKPGQRQRKDVRVPTSCVDVLPTLLHLTGQPVPDWCEGKMLPELAGEAGDDDNDERSVFSVEAKANPERSPLVKGTVVLIKGQHKLIHYFGYPEYESEYELYDLADDPEELDDLYPVRKAVAAEMRSELEEKLREVNQPYIS